MHIVTWDTWMVIWTWTLKALKYKIFRYLASILRIPACMYWYCHPYKHHSTGGRMCWLSVLQISQWPQILLRPYSAMLLAWHTSPLPLLPVKPARILPARGFNSLACLVGLCSTCQKKPTSLCLLLASVTEQDKTDEQGVLNLFPRALHHSGNRDPESRIPFQRLSTIHRQGAMNLKVWCRNCWCKDFL